MYAKPIYNFQIFLLFHKFESFTAKNEKNANLLVAFGGNTLRKKNFLFCYFANYTTKNFVS